MHCIRATNRNEPRQARTGLQTLQVRFMRRATYPPRRVSQYASERAGFNAEGLCGHARRRPARPRRPALRGGCRAQDRMAHPRPAAAEHHLLPRPQPDRRHHRGVRRGPGRAGGGDPRRQWRLFIGRRRQGVSGDCARRHVGHGPQYRGARALPEARHLRHGEIRHGGRLRTRDGLRYPHRHRRHHTGAAGGFAGANSRQRRQPAGRPHRGAHPRRST